MSGWIEQLVWRQKGAGPWLTICCSLVFAFSACRAPVAARPDAPTPASPDAPTPASPDAPTPASPEEPSEARTGGDEPPRPQPASRAASPPVDDGSEGRLSELEVPGFRPSLLVLPRGFSERRAWPLLLAAHGAGDNAWWQCSTWAPLVEERAVLVCPAGDPLSQDPRGGYYFKNHHALEAEVVAVVQALHRTFADRVLGREAVYIAYSQGATMGALMLVGHGRPFSRLVLIEGGSGQWNVAQGLDYKHSGGQRVLFACGTAACALQAERSRQWLERAGLLARTLYVDGAGHTYGGALQAAVEARFSWVVEGLRSWAEPDVRARSPRPTKLPDTRP